MLIFLFDHIDAPGSKIQRQGMGCFPPKNMGRGSMLLWKNPRMSLSFGVGYILLTHFFNIFPRASVLYPPPPCMHLGMFDDNFLILYLMSSIERSYLRAMPAKVSLLLTVWLTHSRDIRPIGEDLENEIH